MTALHSFLEGVLGLWNTRLAHWKPIFPRVTHPLVDMFNLVQ